MKTLPRWVWFTLRALAIFCPILLCASPSTLRSVHEAMRTPAELVIKALMPGFLVKTFDIRTTGAHVVVYAELTNERYVVASGRAIPPGGSVSASTPARQTLLACFLPLVVTGVFLPRSVLATGATLACAAVIGIGVYLLAVPAVLVGVIWALISPDQVEVISVEALTIWISKFMLHGGGYMVAAAFAYALHQRAADVR